jgi:Tfp pilus assembly protein FimT
MKSYTHTRVHGFTVMEFIIGLAFVGVLLAFAAPWLKADPGKAELKTAKEEFQYHVAMASHAANRLNTEITLVFHNDRRAKNHSISFATPGEPNLEPVFREYVLPENIRLHSPESFIRFDSQGKVQSIVAVELTSELNGNLKERFLLN